MSLSVDLHPLRGPHTKPHTHTHTGQWAKRMGYNEALEIKRQPDRRKHFREEMLVVFRSGFSSLSLASCIVSLLLLLLSHKCNYHKFNKNYCAHDVVSTHFYI